jgi:beta-lactamase regulating signal transducer with metallopeptidase domain
MTMSGFLLLLVKVNLAMGAAIILVSLIRRPLRAQFGAPIAYAIWLLVPIASIASLLPPRESPAHVATVPAPSLPVPIMGHTAHSALRAVEQLAGQSALMPPAPMKPLAPTYGLFDTSPLLFAAWVLGTLFMAAYLTRVQLRFSAAVRRGQAGPAVLGFFRPCIVMPDSFQEQFTAQEQAAILAHERVHLARQDARINALAAFLRCFCWFNPLIHLGARFLRIDQELACDAVAVSASVSRQTYAKALLKSQLMVGVLPFGCNWPGPQHPLVERIALLQGKPPGAARRLAGVSFVILAAICAGLGAWAAQPPVAAKSMARVTHTQAKASPDPVMTANAQRSAEQALPRATESSTAALPTNRVAINQTARFQTNEAATMSAATRLPAAPPLPKEVSASETDAASNDPSATPVQPPPPVVALNGQPVGPPTARDLSVGPVQARLSTPPATLPKFDPNAPYEIRRCTGTVTGRVISPTAIQIPNVVCGGFSGDGSSNNGDGMGAYGGFALYSGACRGPQTLWAAEANLSVPLPSCTNRPLFTMAVEFANPADTDKIPLGKMVRLKGDFRFITQNKVRYLLVQNAKFLYADPFGR